MDVRSAVSKINKRGILLVYPLQNRTEPASLWSEFYPRTKMRWEWDSGSDDRVADMWHMKTQLSGSGKVVYAKWYQGRATFFSKDLFPSLIAATGAHEGSLTPTARRVLRVLEEDSPLSTKELKKRTSMTGRSAERDYEKALKELWRGLFIVGYGEIDDGAFPSLAIGATNLLFDDLWQKAQVLDRTQAENDLAQKLGEQSLFYKFYVKQRASDRPAAVKKAKGVIHYEDLVNPDSRRNR